VLVGIAGGSGSGKTTVANAIMAKLGSQSATLLPCDAYYLDQSHIPLDKRERINFDHPECLQTDLLIKHVRELRDGKSIERPVYNFASHTRALHGIRVEPRQIILVEGNFILCERALRRLFDLKIFVDTGADIRFIRRLQRDVSERGRTTESVIRQYLATVRPMHMKFVEPSRQYADLIVVDDNLGSVRIDPIISRIEALLQ
jgi:uridine kinase